MSTRFHWEYGEYLKTDTWKEVRKKMIMRRPCCERCKSKSVLQVHHKTYARMSNELFRDLCVLCNDCHHEYHERFWKASALKTDKFILEKNPDYEPFIGNKMVTWKKSFRWLQASNKKKRKNEKKERIATIRRIEKRLRRYPNEVTKILSFREKRKKPEKTYVATHEPFVLVARFAPISNTIGYDVRRFTVEWWKPKWNYEWLNASEYWPEWRIPTFKPLVACESRIEFNRQFEKLS